MTVVQEGTKQDGSRNDPPVQVTDITLDKTELSLETGVKTTLAATVEPADATIKSVSWSSNNPEVAAVHPVTGEITAIAEGTAVVTATSSSNKDVSASCTVTVGGEPVVPTGRSLISEMNFYSRINPDKSYSNIKLTYDNQNRITKWEEENSDEEYRDTRTITFEYGDGIVHITSTASSDDPDEPNTYTAYLNKAGFVTRTEGPDLDATSYEYNSENRLIRMTQVHEWQEYIWENGNITRIKYGNDQGETNVTNYTYYENLENRENFDLFFDRISWDEELAIAGLTGMPCRNLLHEERGESEWAYKDNFDMEYEVDGNGYITKAVQTQPQLSSSGGKDDAWIGEIKHISGK